MHYAIRENTAAQQRTVGNSVWRVLVEVITVVTNKWDYNQICQMTVYLHVLLTL